MLGHRYGPRMDWVQMILDFLAAIVWPVVVVAAILVFREPISERIRRLTNVRAGSASAEFGAALATTEADASLKAVEPIPVTRTRLVAGAQMIRRTTA